MLYNIFSFLPLGIFWSFLAWTLALDLSTSALCYFDLGWLTPGLRELLSAFYFVLHKESEKSCIRPFIFFKPAPFIHIHHGQTFYSFPKGQIHTSKCFRNFEDTTIASFLQNGRGKIHRWTEFYSSNQIASS